MDHYDLRTGAEVLGALVGDADLFIARVAPWALAKAAQEAQLDEALAALYRTLYRLAVLSSPFIPEKSAVLWEALGQSGTPGQEAWGRLQLPPDAGVAVRRPAILFPKPPVSRSPA
jgi:methionyl-tRNA synthetase